MLLPAPGVQLTSLTHVEDVASMLAAVPGNRAAIGQHYNVCSDRCITFTGEVEIEGEGGGGRGRRGAEGEGAGEELWLRLWLWLGRSGAERSGNSTSDAGLLRRDWNGMQRNGSSARITASGFHAGARTQGGPGLVARELLAELLAGLGE